MKDIIGVLAGIFSSLFVLVVALHITFKIDVAYVIYFSYLYILIGLPNIYLMYKDHKKHKKTNIDYKPLTKLSMAEDKISKRKK